MWKLHVDFLMWTYWCRYTADEPWPTSFRGQTTFNSLLARTPRFDVGGQAGVHALWCT